MFWCLFLVLIVSFTVATQTAPWTNQEHFKVAIIQPNSTDVADRSFNVAVTIGMDLLGGGVLVSQRWVLTAASVVHGMNMSDIRVRLGSNSAYQGGRHHRVRDVIEHPSFSPNNTSYNLALLRMDRNVSYQIARHISFLARIPFGYDKSFGNITGYGQDHYGVQLTEDVALQWTKVQLYSRTYCTNNWHISIPNTQFCGWNSEGSAPCYGDIGDPLTKCVSDRRCELLGIYTGYNLCGAEPGQPQTYVDIGQFRDWVKGIIRQNRTAPWYDEPRWDEFE